MCSTRESWRKTLNKVGGEIRSDLEWPLTEVEKIKEEIKREMKW